MCNSSSFCCPVTCGSDFLPKKQLIGIKRCTPFQSLCDGTTVTTIYTSATTPSQELPSGIITVVNTSTDCTMTVTISEDGTALPPYTVTPQSSITVDVTRLSSVTVTCSGLDPLAYCSGSFEADLQYTAYQS